MEQIYYLKLGERKIFNGISVLRVPGGWIFTQGDYVDASGNKTSVFIPYNEEFIKK